MQESITILEHFIFISKCNLKVTKCVSFLMFNCILSVSLSPGSSCCIPTITTPGQHQLAMADKIELLSVLARVGDVITLPCHYILTIITLSSYSYNHYLVIIHLQSLPCHHTLTIITLSSYTYNHYLVIIFLLSLSKFKAKKYKQYHRIPVNKGLLTATRCQSIRNY